MSVKGNTVSPTDMEMETERSNAYNADETSMTKSPEESNDWNFPHYILPPVASVWLLVALAITFAISESNGHTNAEDFPYISHISSVSPQLYIFAQLVNIGSVLLIIVGVIRYHWVKEKLKEVKIKGCCSKEMCRWVNLIALIIGVICAFGLSLVSIFPAGSGVMKWPHGTGGFIAFAFGFAYCLMETFLSAKLCCTLLCWSYIMQVGWTFFAFVSLITFTAGMAYNDNIGYNDAVFKVSSVAEWMNAIIVCTYTLTYTCEFRQVRYKATLIHTDRKAKCCCC